jgi:hypothetical protein
MNLSVAAAMLGRVVVRRGSRDREMKSGGRRALVDLGSDSIFSFGFLEGDPVWPGFFKFRPDCLCASP